MDNSSSDDSCGNDINWIRGFVSRTQSPRMLDGKQCICIMDNNGSGNSNDNDGSNDNSSSNSITITRDINCKIHGRKKRSIGSAVKRFVHIKSFDNARARLSPQSCVMPRRSKHITKHKMKRSISASPTILPRRIISDDLCYEDYEDVFDGDNGVDTNVNVNNDTTADIVVNDTDDDTDVNVDIDDVDSDTINNHSSQCSITDLLCNDILVIILTYLPLTDIITMRQVCVLFHRLITRHKLLGCRKFNIQTICRKPRHIPDVIDTLAAHNNMDAIFLRGIMHFDDGRIIDSCIDFHKYFNNGGKPRFHTDGTCVIGAAIGEFCYTASQPTPFYAILYIHRVECYHLRIVICDEHAKPMPRNRKLMWECCKVVAKYDLLLTRDNIRFADADSCASFRKYFMSEYPICLADTNIVLDNTRVALKDHKFKICELDSINGYYI